MVLSCANQRAKRRVHLTKQYISNFSRYTAVAMETRVGCCRCPKWRSFISFSGRVRMARPSNEIGLRRRARDGLTIKVNGWRARAVEGVCDNDWSRSHGEGEVSAAIIRQSDGSLNRNSVPLPPRVGLVNCHAPHLLQFAPVSNDTNAPARNARISVLSQYPPPGFDQRVVYEVATGWQPTSGRCHLSRWPITARWKQAVAFLQTLHQDKQ